MRDSSGSLRRIILSNEPVAVVLYKDFSARNELVELIKVLSPTKQTVRVTSDPNEIFARTTFTETLLLLPDNEVATIALLDGRRDTLVDRERPAIVFLLKDGEALQSLKNLPAIMGWLRGNIVDPDALESIDVDAERAVFQAETGQTPEEWLAEWRSGRAPDTLANNLALHRALLLERSP